MKHQYKKPPIEEAIVEFRFEPTQEWDFTIPGKLHEQSDIKKHYSGRPRNQKLIEATYMTQPQQPPNLAVREGLSTVSKRRWSRSDFAGC